MSTAVSAYINSNVYISQNFGYRGCGCLLFEDISL